MEQLHNELQNMSETYKEWHQHPHHKKLHWVLFLIGALLLATSLIKYAQFSYAAQLTAPVDITARPLAVITKDFVATASKLSTTAPADRAALVLKLKTLAKERSKAIVVLAEKSPQTILKSLISDDTISALPADVKSLVENRKKVKGKFQWIHWHGTNHDEAVDTFFITDASTKKKYRIAFAAGGQEQFKRGLDTMELTGLFISASDKDKNLNNEGYDGVAIADLPNSLQQPTTQILGATTGPAVKKYALTLIEFNGMPNPVTNTQAQQKADAAATYFNTVSFGKIALQGKSKTSPDVYRVNAGALDCSTGATTTAKSAALASGIDLSTYDYVGYVYPILPEWYSGTPSPCAFAVAAAATMTGTPRESYYFYADSFFSAGSTIPTDPSVSNDHIMFHELGHNFDFQHSNANVCREEGDYVPMSSDANCFWNIEYGDGSSIMGGSLTASPHPNNYFKGESTTLPWLDSANTKTLTRSGNPDGTYTVAPIEFPSTGIQSLRVARGINQGPSGDLSYLYEFNGIPTYYYIEYRQPDNKYDFARSANTIAGIDDGIATPGIFIRIAPDYNYRLHSFLIDTDKSGDPNDFTDAPLNVGQTFTDKVLGINVTLISTSASGAQVRVWFTPPSVACTSSASTVTLTPSAPTVAPGQSVTYTYSIKNNSTSTCVKNTFTPTLNLPTGFTTTPATLPTETIAPGATITRQFTLYPPTPVTLGTQYPISVTAVNTADVTKNGSGSATYRELSGDITSPIVTISSPTSGARVGRTMTLTASATDASGIKSIGFYLDGYFGSPYVICNYTTTTTSQTCSQSIPTSFSKGTHTFTAQAVDASVNANIGSANVQFKK